MREEDRDNNLAGKNVYLSFGFELLNISKKKKKKRRGERKREIYANRKNVREKERERENTLFFQHPPSQKSFAIM